MIFHSVKPTGKCKGIISWQNGSSSSSVAILHRHCCLNNRRHQKDAEGACTNIMNPKYMAKIKYGRSETTQARHRVREGGEKMKTQLRVTQTSHCVHYARCAVATTVTRIRLWTVYRQRTTQCNTLVEIFTSCRLLPFGGKVWKTGMIWCCCWEGDAHRRRRRKVSAMAHKRCCFLAMLAIPQTVTHSTRIHLLSSPTVMQRCSCMYK